MREKKELDCERIVVIIFHCLTMARNTFRMVSAFEKHAAVTLDRSSL